MLLFFAVALDVFSPGMLGTGGTRGWGASNNSLHPAADPTFTLRFLKAAESEAAAGQTAAHRGRTTEPPVFIQLLAELLSGVGIRRAAAAVHGGPA